MAKAKFLSAPATTNAYNVYTDALKNAFTRKNYEIHFKAFMKSLKASSSCNELLTMEGRTLEDAIVQHMKALDSSGASTSHIAITLAAIKKFFVENRAENKINWVWLKGRKPKSNGKVKDRDYTKDELLKMWTQSDIRKRAILALLMTGIRKGAIPGLRYGNLAKIAAYKDKEKKMCKFESHIYKLTVYETDPSEYITFLTPEGAKAIDLYIEARKAAGETINQNSPLIRDAFDTMNAKEPKPVTTAALDMAFTRLTRTVGIRPKKKEGERQDRHEVMLFHGIRKFVNHAYVNAGAEPIKKELLIGHSPPGLEGSYLRPTEDELLTEFVKVIQDLTLGEEAELRQQAEELKTQVSDVGAMKLAYLDIKSKMEALEEENKKLVAEKDVKIANHEWAIIDLTRKIEELAKKK
ncbi:MAG TPA: hypothetical protein VGQ13_01220 [Nitrososphaera sp.]|nr:hypothetical protein [Nitrososphaera sp.]